MRVHRAGVCVCLGGTQRNVAACKLFTIYYAEKSFWAQNVRPESMSMYVRVLVYVCVCMRVYVYATCSPTHSKSCFSLLKPAKRRQDVVKQVK